ncbi:response regulator [Sphingomonas sp.]|uniref:response regulator n=1 Tax=Sphingomonas sp. TaxID=28214 RepID=UPI0026007245|nr:response regulator [Sphingomonas sp.]
MHAQLSEAPVARIGISLVDGDATARRDRQLMLRAENFDVRSYATGAALIADPLARATACLVVDVDMPGLGGVELVQSLRVSGWRGTAILLRSVDVSDSVARDAERDGDTLLLKTMADRPLLEAIRAALKPRSSRSEAQL